MWDALRPDSGLASFFQFQKFGTSVQTEVVAGLSTYLSLAYIFIVTPAILSGTGIDPSAVLLATVIASTLSTVLMGLWANLPFAVAPGLEMSGFFAFVVCGTLHMSWEEGLGTVFISGLLCLFFTTLRIRKSIIDAIPSGLKKAIGTSVGVFVATIGLFLSHIVIFKNGRIDFASLSIFSLWSRDSIVLYSGLGVSVLFGATRMRFPGGLLVAILTGAALCAVLGVEAIAPPELSTKMTEAIGRLDVGVVLDARFWSPIIVFFIIDFLGGIGKFIGLTANTNIQDAEGNIPNLTRGLYVDGGGTVLGSLLGTSSLIAFVESSVGIQAGGRTGLTALVCGLLMALSILATPLLRWTPAESAAGVLLYVGYLLLPGTGDKHSGQTVVTRFDVGVAGAMGILSFLTFSLDKALALGFWAYFIQSWVTPQVLISQRLWLGGIAVVLTGTIIWQMLTT